MHGMGGLLSVSFHNQAKFGESFSGAGHCHGRGHHPIGPALSWYGLQTMLQ